MLQSGEAFAVVPGLDLTDALIHAAPGSDGGEVDLARERALGIGGEPVIDNMLTDARVVRPGLDEPPLLLAASPGESVRIVRPGGLDIFETARGAVAIAQPTGGKGMRIVRPTGGAGAGVAGALLSTSQLAAGGRVVKPGQGSDVRPKPTDAPTATVLTDVPTPQP